MVAAVFSTWEAGAGDAERQRGAALGGPLAPLQVLLLGAKVPLQARKRARLASAEWQDRGCGGSAAPRS